jgi:large subunit ribosomal protein L13
MENKTKETRPEVVIDAANSILGRMASYAAKQALLGKNVIIVNCNHTLLTGRRRMVIGEYGHSRRRGGRSLNGPHFPKNPERIVKRTVRGMLSYTQQRGLDALKRVMCYNLVPKEYESSKKVTFPSTTKSRTMSLGDLSKEI